MLWSFSPLIIDAPSYIESSLKNLFIIAQAVWLPSFLGDTEVKNMRNSFIKLCLWLILIVQTFEFVFVWLIETHK